MIARLALTLACCTLGLGASYALAGGGDQPPDSNCPETLANACSTCPVAQGYGGDTTTDCTPTTDTSTSSTPASTVTVTETTPPATLPAQTVTVQGPTQILTVVKDNSTTIEVPADKQVKGKTSHPKKHKRKHHKVKGKLHHGGGVTG